MTDFRLILLDHTTFYNCIGDNNSSWWVGIKQRVVEIGLSIPSLCSQFSNGTNSVSEDVRKWSVKIRV